jgi:two-component system response regulator FixJ
MKQTVFIVEDDRDIATYISELLARNGFQSKSFHSAEDFLDTVSRDARGCVIGDIMLPGMNGLAMLAELRKRNSWLPCIVLSGFATVKRTVMAFTDGAYTLIEKPADEGELIDAVTSALEKGEQDYAIAHREADFDACFESLSRGEREVFQCMMKGMPNKLIAFELHVSLRTIEARRRKVFKKMKAESLAELVAFALSSKHRNLIDAKSIAI